LKFDEHGPPHRSGSAYVFDRDGLSWSQAAKLHAGARDALDYAGSAVSVSGDTVWVGASGADAPGISSGAAFVFVAPAELGTSYCACPTGPCGNSDPAAGCANSTGAGARLRAQGRTLPDELNLLVSGARPGQPAIFCQGDNALMLPFGDGLRCIGGSVVRISAPAPSKRSAVDMLHVPYGPRNLPMAQCKFEEFEAKTPITDVGDCKRNEVE
jgi:hypothetical protein